MTKRYPSARSPLPILMTIAQPGEERGGKALGIGYARELVRRHDQRLLGVRHAASPLEPQFDRARPLVAGVPGCAPSINWGQRSLRPAGPERERSQRGPPGRSS